MLKVTNPGERDFVRSLKICNSYTL